MSCKKTVSKSAVKSLSICGICHKEISDEDCGYLTYGCELCPVWLHAKCIFCDACEDELKTIFKFNRAFDVKCDSCRQALKKNDSSNIKVTQQIHNELNKKLPQIVTEVVKAYQEACQESLVKDLAPFKSFAEIMNEQESAIQLFKDKNNQSIDKIVETVSDIKQQLDKCPKEYQEDDIKEINSRKRKRKNLLLFNLPESTNEPIADQLADDCAKFRKVISDKFTLTNKNIVNIFRIGTKTDDKIRPLLVQCDTEKTKWDIIKVSKHLKYFAENQESFPIYVSLDYTPKERQERKALIMQLNERIKNGEKDLVLRGNRLVKKSINHPFRQTAQQFSNVWAQELENIEP